MNHYPHHIGDFNNATRHLTRVERSLYRDMIELYYDTEQPLNSDIQKLARRIICDESDLGSLREVLNEFFVLQDDGFHNDRCDRELAKYHGLLEQASKAGKASAQQRANRKATPVERPLKFCSTNQNQEPEPILTNKLVSTAKQVSLKIRQVVPRPEGVDEKLWSDFLTIRKAKKAPVTETAIEGLKREAQKAGVEFSVALATCCERGWSTFKADWVADKKTGTVLRFDPKAQAEVKAQSLGMQARPGESWDEFSRRVNANAMQVAQ